jgi:hypothetical protein
MLNEGFHIHLLRCNWRESVTVSRFERFCIIVKE